MFEGIDGLIEVLDFALVNIDMGAIGSISIELSRDDIVEILSIIETYRETL